jgi:glyoxylase-like metal-dependent hydrolase (beta-lactamase superfamily II)
MNEITPGLWTWTAPHPEWTPESGGPAGWEQNVNSNCLAPVESGEPMVLIDPLLPSDAADRKTLWRELEIFAGRAADLVDIVILNRYHGRSASLFCQLLADLRKVRVHAHEAAGVHLSCDVTHPFTDGDTLVAGLQLRTIEGMSPGESVLWIPSSKSLVFGDSLLGCGNDGACRTPRGWLPEAARYEDTYMPSLERLLELKPERLLLSHGPSVLANGTSALEQALQCAPWGECQQSDGCC